MVAIAVSSITFSSWGSAVGVGVGIGSAVGIVKTVGASFFSVSALSDCESPSPELSALGTSVSGRFTSSSSLRSFTLVALDDRKKSSPAEGRPAPSEANVSKLMPENKRAADTA